MSGADAEINEQDRRPIRSRGWRVFDRAAHAMARRGVSPNAVSMASVVCAVVGAGLIIGSAYVGHGIAARAMLLLAAVAVQGRLVCNMLDGMVAERGPGGSLVGRLYNEAPDRVSDILLLLAMGWLVASPEDVYLGALAACGAVLTAYVRGLAYEVGAPQPFCGPMAKPQRMALLTAVLLVLALLPGGWLVGWWGPGGTDAPVGRWGLVESALWVVIAGCGLTACRRLAQIARHARGQGDTDDDG